MKYISSFILTFTFLCIHIVQAEEVSKSHVKQMSENVYNIINLEFSNIGVVVGNDAVALIESGMGDYQNHTNENVLKLIRTITKKPVKYVINLHSHPDHNGGNNYFTERGATLITHENVVYSEFYDDRYPDKNMVRFNERLALDMGNETIEIQHMIAHTFDDGIVYLKNSNLVFIGESYKPNYITYLGKLGKTSFDEWGDKALAKMDQQTVVIPSHGNATINKTQLITYRQNVTNWYQRIMDLYQQGKNIDDIVKDEVALSHIKQNDLDSNHDHHGKYYKEDIQDLIRSSVPTTPLLDDTLIQQYLGTYTQAGKVSIEIVLIRGHLVAKQHHGFISWLKPISKNKFDSISFFKESFFFEMNPTSGVTQLRIEFPGKAPYQNKVSGVWLKK